MQKLVELTGLSSHCLDVLYDFNPHRFAPVEKSPRQPVKAEQEEEDDAEGEDEDEEERPGKAPKQRLLDIICLNQRIFTLNRDVLRQEAETLGKKPRGESALRKAIVQRREQELEAQRKAGALSVEAKDQLMVHEFTGTAHTSGGHFIYCYYVGPAERAPRDLGAVHNWVPVNKQHLSLFHRRLGKSVARYYAYQSAHVTETVHGSAMLALDMRFIVQKWLNSQQGERLMPLLRENGHLFARGEDYLARRHQAQQQALQAAPSAEPLPVKRGENERVETLVEFGDHEDPYEVRDADLCHISDAEYERQAEMPLDSALSFGFQHFIDVSRRSCPRKEGEEAPPPQYYEHDPIHLFDALTIACNLEAHAHSSVALAMRDHLRVVVNDDMTAVVDYMTQEPSAVRDMQARAEEFLWACMAVENATRKVPAHLQKKLEVV